MTYYYTNVIYGTFALVAEKFIILHRSLYTTFNKNKQQVTLITFKQLCKIKLENLHYIKLRLFYLQISKGGLFLRALFLKPILRKKKPPGVGFRLESTSIRLNIYIFAGNDFP